MTRIAFDIELIDDVVLPRNIATSGTADTHDFIPGSVLLGVFAGRGYRDAGTFASDHTAYDALAELFQSGRVRFQDALPVDGAGTLCVPVPLSLHRPKASAGGGGNAVYDLSVSDRPVGVQLQQMRSGYLSVLGPSNSGYFRGDVFHPRTSFMMRTAINEKTGRAREAQLFGYASLSAGQKFAGAIEYDDDPVLAKQVETMLNLVFGHYEDARIRVGRSKNAEFGRARMVKTDGKSFELPNTSQDSCRLLLLSDLAAFDNLGQPTFAPAPQDLGLSDGVSFDSQNCFVRFRSYAPYNAALGKREPERHVLERGSVLTLRGLSEMDYQILSAGLGAYRQQGLGQVRVLDGVTPMIGDSGPKQAAQVVGPAQIGAGGGVSRKPGPEEQAASDTFLRWLDEVVGAKRNIDIDKIDCLVERWRDAYRSAWVILGAKNGDLYGPTSSQWSNIRKAARDNPDMAYLHDKLFQASDAICKEGDDVWSLKTSITDGGGAFLRLRDVLAEQIEHLKQDVPDNPADHLVALCAEMEREVKDGALSSGASRQADEEVSQ